MRLRNDNSASLSRGRGFTIVELLIVIVIIGILSAIVYVAYNGIQNRAKVAVVQSDLNVLSRKLEAYRFSTSSTEKYPVDIDCATSPATDTTCLKPSNGNTLQYSVNNTVAPPTFCITVSNGTTSYYLTNTGNPTVGACTGHIVGGQYGSLPVATSIDGYWTTAPQGFMLEDGSAVSRATYADLFAIIGTTYGSGDGTTTFNLPDSRGYATVNRNSLDSEFATIGQKTGSKAEQLTIAQMPSHTHVQDPHTHTATSTTETSGLASGSGGIASALRAAGSSYTWTTQVVTFASTVAVNQSTGGDQPHNNIQPSIVKMSAIKYAAIDPSAAELPAGTSLNGYWQTAPSGYVAEDGADRSRSGSDLFTAIGTAGSNGDGSTTFGVPDSRGRAGVNKSSTDTEFDAMGEKTGSKTETLTIAQMPSHTHVQNAHTHTATGRTDAYSGASGFTGSASAMRAAGTSYTLTNSYVSVDTTVATNQSTGGGQSHNNIQPSIVKLTVIKTDNGTSGAAVAVGTSVGGYWSSTPSGYLPEDGVAVSRATYAALFAVIGTTYGVGDGSTTFNVPDSRGRLSVNRSLTDVEFDTMGEKYGTKTVTLTIAQMPSHTHIQDAHTHLAYGRTEATGTASGFGGITSATRPAQAQYTQNNQVITVTAATATNQSTGGGGAHNDIQPSIVKSYVIKF